MESYDAKSVATCGGYGNLKKGNTFFGKEVGTAGLYFNNGLLFGFWILFSGEDVVRSIMVNLELAFGAPKKRIKPGASIYTYSWETKSLYLEYVNTINLQLDLLFFSKKLAPKMFVDVSSMPRNV